MKKKVDNFNEVLDTLKRLHDAYPTQPVGQHIALATSDYPSTDMTDKELNFALSKYEQELELNESFNSTTSDWEYKYRDDEDLEEEDI